MTVAFWMVNTVDVESILGVRNGQNVYGDPTPVDCWLEDEIKEVRDSTGQQVVSSATVFTSTDDAALFPVGSKVTLPDRTAFVITNHPFNSGSLALGLDHAEITLT